MPTEVVDGMFDMTSRVEKSAKRYRVFLFVRDTPTIVDSGLAESVDNVIEGIDDIGVTPDRLVVTHGDSDHVGGFDALVDESTGVAVMGDAVSGVVQRGLQAGYVHLPRAPYSETLNSAEESL